MNGISNLLSNGRILGPSVVNTGQMCRKKVRRRLFPQGFKECGTFMVDNGELTVHLLKTYSLESRVKVRYCDWLFKHQAPELLKTLIPALIKRVKGALMNKNGLSSWYTLGVIALHSVRYCLRSRIERGYLSKELRRQQQNQPQRQQQTKLQQRRWQSQQQRRQPPRHRLPTRSSPATFFFPE